MRYLLLITCLAALAACGSEPGDSASSEPAPRPPILVLARQAAERHPASGDAAQLYASSCALCHGAGGEGKRALHAPSIAGAPAWYLAGQLSRFRQGLRGDHPDDLPGRAMAQVARSLPEAALRPLAEHIQTLQPIPTTRTVAGDAAHGRLVYGEQCMECHRYNGSGEQLFASSPLTSFQDWYLQRELEEFRNGLRGQHAGDVPGGKMRVVAQFLDDRSRRDVIAYISELAKAHPPGR